MLKPLLKGLTITFKKMFMKPMSVNYPFEERDRPESYRGRHVLTTNEEGLENCVGCGLCGAFCPVDAIFIQGEDNPEDQPVSIGERYASEYEIDASRCIFCGYCEDACPTDAIILTDEFEMSVERREELLWDKDFLLEETSGSS